MLNLQLTIYRSNKTNLANTLTMMKKEISTDKVRSKNKQNQFYDFRRICQRKTLNILIPILKENGDFQDK